jgi:hypothetical protein
MFFKLRILWFFRQKSFIQLKFLDKNNVHVKDKITNIEFNIDRNHNKWVIYNRARFIYVNDKTLNKAYSSYLHQQVVWDIRDYCDKILDLKRSDCTKYLVDNRSCHDALFARFKEQYKHLIK